MMEGYESLKRRFAAVERGIADPALMTLLGLAAVREQKLLEASHRKTGVTGASIRLKSVTTDSATTVVGGAGRFLEHGTAPHVITPRAAGVLAWAQGEAGGKFRRLSGRTRKGVASANMVFARRVNHPGTRADPFMVPGAKAAMRNAGLLERVVELWDRAG